jgi:hypothetical protein
LEFDEHSFLHFKKRLFWRGSANPSILNEEIQGAAITNIHEGSADFLGAPYAPIFKGYGAKTRLNIKFTEVFITAAFAYAVLDLR